MSPRPTIHRDFSIAPAGFYTVLRPAARFVRSRLPEPFRDYLGRPRKPLRISAITVPGQPSDIPFDNSELLSRLQILPPAEQNPHFLRLLLILLAAVALSCVALWFSGNA